MRAHALNVAGVACAHARSGARKGSDNLAQGGAQRSPGSASAQDGRALKGRDRRQAVLAPPRLIQGVALMHCGWHRLKIDVAPTGLLGTLRPSPRASP